MKVNLGHESEVSARAETMPRAGLSERAIRRQLLAGALQHPATLLPLAASAMTTIWLVLLSPVVGAGLWAIVLLTVSGTVAICSFVWRYVFRYADEHAGRVRDLIDLQDREEARQEQIGLALLREDLEGEFSAIAPEGLKALDGLVEEYEQLRTVLDRGIAAYSLSALRIPDLAADTYRRGLSILSDALELMKAASTPRREMLERDIGDLERQLEAPEGDESHGQRIVMKEDRLVSLKLRLSMVDQLQLRVDQLLFQVERCEATLHRTRMELVAIRTGSSESSVDSVVAALQGTIRHVKEVQEELKRLGY